MALRAPRAPPGRSCVHTAGSFASAPRQPQPAARRHRSRLLTACAASVRARWLLDARYGHKTEATALVREWVEQVGAAAGLAASNARLVSGAFGVPESRIELEADFDSLADFERFLARVPAAPHRAWSQRMQGMVVDGSPRWEVYRTVSVFDGAAAVPAAASAASSSGGSTSGSSAAQPPLLRPGPALGSAGLVMPTPDQLRELAAGSIDLAAAVARQSPTRSPPGPPAAAPPPTPTPSDVEPAPAGVDAGGDMVLDWKGEPMKLNPGDKMPGARGLKFL
jgi:hypothetical protein